MAQVERGDIHASFGGMERADDFREGVALWRERNRDVADVYGGSREGGEGGDQPEGKETESAHRATREMPKCRNAEMPKIMLRYFPKDMDNASRSMF